MRKTIKSKIAWLTVLAMTMIVLSFTAFVYVYLEKWMVSQEIQASFLRAAQIAHTYQSHLDEGAGQRSVMSPSWLSRLVHRQKLPLVYDAHGRLVEHTGKLSVPGGQHQLASLHNAMLLIGGRHYARVIIRAQHKNGRPLGTIVRSCSFFCTMRPLTRNGKCPYAWRRGCWTGPCSSAWRMRARASRLNTSNTFSSASIGWLKRAAAAQGERGWDSRLRRNWRRFTAVRLRRQAARGVER